MAFTSNNISKWPIEYNLKLSYSINKGQGANLIKKNSKKGFYLFVNLECSCKPNTFL